MRENPVKRQLVSCPRDSMNNSGLAGPPRARLGPRREPANLAPAPPPLRGASRRGRRRGVEGAAPHATASRTRLARGPDGRGAARQGLNYVVNFGDRTLAAGRRLVGTMVFEFATPGITGLRTVQI
jgi:hypothetical protein